ncbi:MAG: YegS/Rv2252/BmrU family lipid kinase [Clostridia bacterium]|nr:YegS/Rv2252/BmrU family lipid kinase [Clostridia bacterium]
MKTVFIINPKAGQGKDIDALAENIRNTAEALKKDYEIYFTKYAGDARSFVSEYLKENGAARFIACGGDGTLNEVVNGAISYDDAEVGVIPIGTGNDFCRNFGSADVFRDVKAQFVSNSQKCDAISYKTTVNGKGISGYAVNMFNIGFDCNVADLTSRMKQKPFISGSLAYFLSIFVILIKKKGANLRITADGNTINSGKLLLSAIANGSFCGGGVKSNPLASVTDGLININIIKNVSRLRLLTLLPCYMKGTFPEKNVGHIIFSKKYKKVVIEPLNNYMRLCVDGEITDAGNCEFEILPKAFKFVVPERVSESDFPDKSTESLSRV